MPSILDRTVKYATTQRDCIDVPEEAYAYSDGCHSDLPANGPARALIMETFAVCAVSLIFEK